MANDITGINSSRAHSSQNRSASSDTRNIASNDSRSDDTSSAADRVSLTSTASRLKDIEQQLSSSSSVDNQRVRQVQSAISNGEYNIDSDRIADKMLAFEDFMNR